MRVWVFGIAIFLVACSSSSSQRAVVVHTPEALAAGTKDAAADLTSDLEKLVGYSVTKAGLPHTGCTSGEVHVVVLGHEHDETGAKQPSPLGAQEYSIEETRCGDDGHLVVLRGGSLQAAQWAVYDFAERLGVRFFHPEQTLYPAALVWPAAAIDVTTHPAIAARAFHLHRTHPIELSPPLDANPADTKRYQHDWIAWNVKLRHTAVDGYDDDSADYAYERGFAREGGLNLVETQQGATPVIDPTDPRPESEQISTAIDAQMATVAGKPDLTTFEFEFNPSEFTTADEQVTVDRINFVSNYIHGKWPNVELKTINHGTAEAPGPVYGVRFFDLSQFGPPELGVEVHPLMFYDLDRAAPVYGNANFNNLRDWIIAQQAVRRITYYPETSWWLTFDLPVPLYLAPVSLEARDHDLSLLAPYASGDATAPNGVIGHKAFTSGQEWGYWMIDYCTAQMTWQLDLGWIGCLDHVTQVFEAGDMLRDLLVEVGKAQVDPLRDPGILAMLVGSDDGTETAAQAGIIFHPLPPSPAEILGWDDAKVAEFQMRSLDPLPAFAASYAAWAMRVDALSALQDDTRAPWLSEISDSLRITGLRAAHAHAVYTTTLALRAAINSHSYAEIATAAASVADAQAITEQARAIVSAREAAYRYPLALSVAGDEVGSAGAIANQTIYPYRYLSRTHRMFYWTRPDAQLAAMFGLDVVKPSARMLVQGTPLVVDVTATDVTGLAISWGDSTTSSILEPHTYASQGLFAWTLDALHTAGVIHHDDRVAVCQRVYTFPKGSLAITAPQGGSIIAGLLPGYAVGLGTDGQGAFTALGQLDSAATNEITNGSLQRRPQTGAQDLTAALGSVGAITIFGAQIAVADGADAMHRQLTITGELSTDEVIELVVTAGGFDPVGARSLVASTLGYTVDTLPLRVPFTGVATGSE